MFEFLFDLPFLITGILIIGTFCVFAVVGLFFVRRQVLPRLRLHESDSEFTGAMMTSVMVFYGLAVALTAVDVYEQHNNVAKIVSREATTLAALYRDVSGYPEPARQQLQQGLADYTLQVIERAWPLHQQGLIPTEGVIHMDRFTEILHTFEPVTEGQKIIHAEALRGYNEMTLARRQRLDASNTGLSGIMWVILVAGGFIGLTTAFFFRVEDPRLHAIQVLLLAIFMGMVIFMIAAFDRPYRGTLGLTPAPYQLVYDQLMKRR
jgi:hypothetical protein